MTVLSSRDIQQRLSEVPGWEYTGQVITKEFTCESFPEALLFVNAVGHASEGMDHHPDIDIRYRRVRLALATHSEKGITDKDFTLAGTIERLARGAA